MGLGIPEIGQHAVAHVSGDKAIVAADRLGDTLLVRTQNLTQVLGVEARRERGRVYDIAEHNRDLPPLGSRRRFVRGRAPRATLPAQGGNRGKHLAAVPDEIYAELLEIFRG